jgi:hypothetical protein
MRRRQFLGLLLCTTAFCTTAFSGEAETDAKLIEESKKLLDKAKKDGSLVRVSTWIHDGKEYLYVMVRKNGWWEGGIPPTGYYSDKIEIKEYNYSNVYIPKK